jgi:hypothetical protein
MIEDVGTALIKMLQRFASTKRVAAIVGKTNRPELKEYMGKDLSNISRVVVSLGNPMAQTIAGRFELANQMLQYQIIKDPRQIFQVLDTGRMDDMYANDQQELMLMKAENENLMAGKPVIATAIDEHMQHINYHKAVIADPELRTDPELVTRVLAHIEEHLQLLRTVDPQLLGAVGQQSLAPPPPPQGMPQGGQPGDVNPQQTQLPPELLQPAVGEEMPTLPGQPQVPAPPPPFNQLPTDPSKQG